MAGWLLGVVGDIKLRHRPSFATVLLGTGNNPYFSFGWGKNPGTDRLSVESILEQVRNSKMKIDSISESLWRERERASRETTMTNAEKMVERTMKGNDASHDAAHVWRVRDLALSLAQEDGLYSDSMEIVELAALLDDIADCKYLRDPTEEKIIWNFLEEEGVDEVKKTKILAIIKGMGFKEELLGHANGEFSPECGVVQDANRQLMQSVQLVSPNALLLVELGKGAP